MKNLRAFIEKHTESTPSGTGDISVEFFDIKVKNNPVASTLSELVKANTEGEFGTSFDLFDSNEHSYLNLGAWIGDQQTALKLMGLGSHLGLWEILSPSTLMPFLPNELKHQMIGQGMVSIKSIAS